MVEPSDHCPYLGLKQNRAIRFASPTPEHRCYVAGDPQEIPVDQASFCLSQEHVRCPLYMGLSVPTIGATVPPVVLPQRGLLGWLRSLNLRDRLIYSALLALLVAIVVIYAAAGAQLLSSALGQGDLFPASTPQVDVTLAPAITQTSAPSATVAPSLTATRAAATSTDIPVTPTKTMVPPTATIDGILEPTYTPAFPSATAQIFITFTPNPVFVTNTALPPPVIPPSATPSVTPEPTGGTATPDITNTSEPATNTAAPASTDTPVLPTSTVQNTEIPPVPTATSEPLPPVPTQEPPPPPPPPTDAPAPTTEPPAPFKNLPATLYFVDNSGQVFIPVQRTLRVAGQRLAEAVVQAQIAGPLANSGLAPLIDANARVLEVRREGTLLRVNLDRHPGDDRGFYALALALTELPEVVRVQLLVNGAPADPTGVVGPLSRPVINLDNPQGQASAYNSGTRFLPLYFRYGGYFVRVTRLVGRSDAVAQLTVEELLAGPGGQYAHVLSSAVPAGTGLLSITLSGGQATLNLSAAFANAPDRRGAVQALALSLTDLRGSGGERRVASVAILVEGVALAEWWGSEFAGPFTRPSLNTE